MAKKAQKKGPEFVRHEDVMAAELRDPEFRYWYQQRRLVHEVAMAVREMREAAGLTQAKLAELIGTSQSVIARLEKGTDQRRPRWDTLHRIALALGKQLTVVFKEPRGRAGKLVEVQDGR